jgi:hypothetical protein
MSRPIPNFEVVDDETAAKYRAMTPMERIQLVNELNLQARERAARRLKERNPAWTPEQVQAEVARLMLAGDEEIFK